MDYIPHTEKEIKEMLHFLDLRSLDELFKDIPAQIKLKEDLKLPDALSENQLAFTFKDIASKNMNLESKSSFLGAGSYNHFVPSAVKAITQRGEFYTAYTPYQPEASQGTLQAIYEFQSLICEITGLDVTNASMYDGASTLAEAVIMAYRTYNGKKLLLSEAIHPEYKEVVKTYLGSNKEIEIIEIPLKDGVTDTEQLKALLDEQTFAVAIQNPNFFGCIEKGLEISEIIKNKNSKTTFIVAITDLISLGVLKRPGDYNADIVAAEGQSLGQAMSFGGPSLGVLAAKESFLRKMPGRLAGRTKDLDGKLGFVLTLQTREQHIRRQKATSNICSNEALCALAAAVYLSGMGKSGFYQVANLCLQKAHYLYDKIISLPGYKALYNTSFFHEFCIKCPEDPAKINAFLRDHQIIGGYNLNGLFPFTPLDNKHLTGQAENAMLFCVTEIITKDQMDHLVNLLGEF